MTSLRTFQDEIEGVRSRQAAKHKAQTTPAKEDKEHHDRDSKHSPTTQGRYPRGHTDTSDLEENIQVLRVAPSIKPRLTVREDISSFRRPDTTRICS